MRRRKTLLQAIPGRSWDGAGRVWRVALTPESADSLACWLRLPGESLRVEPALAAVLEAQRAARDPDECLIELGALLTATTG